MKARLTKLFHLVIFGLGVFCEAMDHEHQLSWQSDSLEFRVKSYLQSIESRVSRRIWECIQNHIDQDGTILWSIVIDKLENLRKSRMLKVGPARMTLCASAANTVWLVYPTLNRIFNLSGTHTSAFDPDNGMKVCLVEQMSPFVPAVEIANIAQLICSFALFNWAQIAAHKHEVYKDTGISDLVRRFIALTFLCNAFFSIFCGPCLVDQAHNGEFVAYMAYIMIGGACGLMNAYLASGDFPAAGRKEHAVIQKVRDIISEHIRQEGFSDTNECNI